MATGMCPESCTIPLRSLPYPEVPCFLTTSLNTLPPLLMFCPALPSTGQTVRSAFSVTSCLNPLAPPHQGLAPQPPVDSPNRDHCAVSTPLGTVSSFKTFQPLHG